MTTTPRPGAGVSRYLRLYRVLSQALAEGRFGEREPLPSEPRLMRDYGVSRSTVRRALARLAAEGRIERKRGSGTFARDRTAGAGPRDLSPLLDGIAAATAATSRTLSFQRIPTPPFLLGNSAFGATTLLIRQIRYVEREPMVFETAYLPEEIGDGLTRRRLDAGRGGAILAVLAAMGHRSASVEREFAALEADPLAASSLGLAVGAPVFNVRSLARDPRSRTLAYVSCLYRPDRYEAHAAIEIGGRKRHRIRKRN